MRPISDLKVLLVSAWLISSSPLDGSDSAIFAKAAPPHPAHGHGDDRHRRRGNDGRGGPPRPKSRFGNSPRNERNDDEGSEPSTSYFERHGMTPPPLLSKQSRSTAARRRRMGPLVDFTGAFSAAAEAAGDAAEGASATGNNPWTTTSLESIVEDAKVGEDPNTRLRHDLLWGDNTFENYYDKHSYPWEYVWHNQTGKLSGLPIEINIDFQRVFSVDVVNSVMDLIVWFRLSWVDPRLTWRPEEYGNITRTWFWIGDGGAGGETSEIWTPDVTLWNLETGLMGSLDDSYARVTNEGAVSWSRPGHLKPTCKFIGLENFPFDSLTCTMEFGSWMLSGRYLTMEKADGIGYKVGSAYTSGSTFEEYTFAEEDPIGCEKYVYPPFNEDYPDEDWPVLLYNVTVSRSWEPYARGYLMTQVILNLVGFSAFWLPPSCGERMGLSITAMLAALASDIVIAANLPAASEMTWFSTFSILSTAFAFLSLVESVVVLYFYYKRSEDLVPSWYTYVKGWYRGDQTEKRAEEVKKATNKAVGRTGVLATGTTNNVVDSFESQGDAKRIRWSTMEKFSLDEMDGRTSSNSRGDDGEDKKDDEDDDVSEGTRRVANNASGWMKGSVKDSIKESASVHFADHLRGDSGHMPSRSLLLGDFKDRYGNSIMAAVPSIPKNADDFLNEEELQNNLYWKHIAARVDDVARFWLPAAFVVALSIAASQVF